MMTKDKYFRVFSHNFPVKGETRSCIYNLHKGMIKFIPNSLYEVLQLLKDQPIAKVEEVFEESDKKVFYEYLQFLIDEHFGFVTDEPDRFPKMPISWETPEKISNAVIEYQFDNYDLADALAQLDKLFCKHLELRITGEVESIKQLRKLFDSVNNKVFRSINLYMKYTPVLEVKEVEALFEDYQKLDIVVVYEAPALKSEQFESEIFYTSEPLEQSAFRESFPRDKYIVNIPYFMETNLYNPYYNKKMAIDKNGNIKNCLLHENSFGNVNDESIESIVEKETFRELWYASHDKIVELKDSELRYCVLISDRLTKLPNGYYTIAS